jgi:hypothetical protein
MYPTYHTSKLKAFVANDPSLFPDCKYTQPWHLSLPTVVWKNISSNR